LAIVKFRGKTPRRLGPKTDAGCEINTETIVIGWNGHAIADKLHSDTETIKYKEQWRSQRDHGSRGRHNRSPFGMRSARPKRDVLIERNIKRGTSASQIFKITGSVRHDEQLLLTILWKEAKWKNNFDSDGELC
jgi:hypothetical protein